MKGSLLYPLLAVFLVAVACERPLSEDDVRALLAETECTTDWFQENIIDLSREKMEQGAADQEVLKIYDDAVELERTPDLLRCRAMVRTDRGETDITILYHFEIDREGDAFYGYRLLE